LSVTAADIDGQSSTSPRPDSPTSSASEADVDWNFARREAALARNGMDPTLESLPDEEINKLYDRITKVKTQRGHKSRPESSLSHTEDVWSDFGRPFGPDAFTDDTSLDPGQGSPELNESVREMQGLLEQQRIEFESRLSTISESSENEDLKLEKEYMEAQLRAVHSQMKRLIEIHARGNRDELEAAEPVLYSARQLRLIRRVLNKWRSHRAFSMAETILSSASLLKEANVAR
jgi:kinesin family protein 1